jgi:glycosyltransferase involved in cell wall biosynthesis
MSAEIATVYQLNLSPSLGGAEFFTAFFSRALSVLGWPTTIVVSGKADYWQRLDLGQGQTIHPASEDAIVETIPHGATLVVHSSAPESLIRRLAKKTRLVALAHQALYNDKQPGYYRYAHLLVPVSGYVIETLKKRNYTNIFPVPLYGIGNIEAGRGDPIRRDVLVDWDRRKLRDRLLARLTPLSRLAHHNPAYEKRVGITLGIVSRIAEAKQFPLLFTHIATHIQARPNVWVEIFGCAVGYRALRELKHAIAPISDHVRFWGMQADVATVYGNIDYLLTGLPERESFGLNIVEAQMCGTPVLAPNAPPFSETVIDGSSGYLYLDPRSDGGQDFARTLDLITQPGTRPDPLSNKNHLAQFEFPAFCYRVEQLMTAISEEKVDSHVDSH